MAGNPVPVPVKEKILCIEDLKEAGSKQMPQGYKDFINSGSTSQQTIAENTTAYAKYRLRSRTLIDVSSSTPATTCFSTPARMPLGISPAGIQSLAHPDGELATARACASKNHPMAISSFANHSVAAIRSAAKSVPGAASPRHAMQMYTLRDRALEERMLREAEAQGCSAVFLTADSPVLGVRYNEWRNDFRTPDGLEYPNIEFTSERIRSASHDNTFVNLNDDAHCWAREVPWLRRVTGMEIWVKGVVCAEDVREAVRWGVDGVVVSNHGGRQLDGVPATIDVLPECVEAARGRVRVHVDGGVRTGADVFKALALGAEFVWVGRPVFWGLAYDGQKGVELMLDTYYQEFKRCMQLCGCNSVTDINKDCLGVVRSDGPLARL